VSPSSSHPRETPGRRGMPVPGGHSFCADSRTPPQRPPEVVSAWRAPTGISESGFPIPEKPPRQSPQGAWCDETLAQVLTLRHRAPGLPHHRHPITLDEALAGIVIALVCVAALIYLLARFA
jgi:hypothetical protein